MPAEGAGQPPARPVPSRLIGDLEDYKAYEMWSVAGGPEAAVLHSSDVRRSGDYSVRFRVKVDYQTAGNPEYPQGWLFLNWAFAQAQDWSAYGGLEFFVFVPAAQPMRGVVLKYGIQTRDAPGHVLWKNISPETLQPGGWTRVVLPFRGLNVRGSLREVTHVRFYVAESWYQDGDELSFYLDDFSLLSAVSGDSEAIRGAAEPMRAPSAYLGCEDAALYPVVPLEFIYPDTDLTKRKPVETLAALAAQGEVKAVSFAVVAGASDITDLSLAVGDLRGPGGALITGNAVDARVVKVWRQAGLHWEVFGKNDGVLVPELLLKDDRIAFREARDDKGNYVAPHVLNVPFGTDVPAHTVKQVWLNIDVPVSAAPGTYEGTMTLDAGTGCAARRVALTLEVLPFRLPEPKLTYGIYYRWRPWTEGRKSISESRFAADLLELRRTGFDSITVPDSPEMERWLSAMKGAGMKGPVVVMGGRERENATKAIEICRKMRMEPYFYGVDEPNGKERFEEHKQLSVELHSAGAKVMTAILPATAQKLASLGQPLDWANHAIQDGHASSFIWALRENDARKTASFETYYWQVYEENPTRNRLLCGFYLWSSGLEGAFPYEYQCPPSELPYTNDARETMHHVKAGGSSRTFRAWFLTYPSQEGPVSTLQWEGCRMGVNDVRYLTLVEQMAAQLAERGDVGLAKDARVRMNEIASLFAKLPADPSVFTNPYVEPAKFERAREQLVDLARRVHRSLHGDR